MTKKKEPKLITERFESKLVMIDGKPFGFSEKIKRPYFPKGLSAVDFTVTKTIKNDDEKIELEITATKEQIETLKKDKKIKWLKH